MSKAKKKAPAPKDVAINRIQFPDEKGGLSLTATHPGFAALSAECVRLFKESKGVNYVEWTMQSGDPEFGIFDVIMQRKTGVTPAQKAAALAVENRRLWHALEELTVRDDKGRWSGCALPEETSCKGACMSGNNVTGWLPKEEKLGT